MKLRKLPLVVMAAIGIATVAVAGFNIAVDPFGAFGDKALKWHAYNMDNNPRIAKVAYLEQNRDRYNSYVIGGSSASSLSPESLNRYYGDDASFYNMTVPDSNVYEFEQTLNYLIEQHQAKHIVLHLGLQDIKETSGDAAETAHAKVSGQSSFGFYLKHAALNPSYGFHKLRSYNDRSNDTTDSFMYNPETGVYNRTERDAEDVNDLEAYMLAGGAAFAPASNSEFIVADDSVAAIQRMKQIAEYNGATFMVIAGAASNQELQSYNMDELKSYWAKLAEITDFWDFSGYSNISADPRYFYDAMHYRNTTGEMMLGIIFDDPDVYAPVGFGHRTTKDNVPGHADAVFTQPPPVSETKVKIPILIYHHIDDNPFEPNSLITQTTKFRSDMEAVKAAGFNTVFFSELIDYVDGKAELPDNPLAITFDDGYYSNYEYAYPVLQELGMKATIHIIGWSVGLQEHRIPGKQFYPHFTWEQSKEMYDSGVIDIQNHTFDMHESQPDNPEVRSGTLQMANETSGEYGSALKEDFGRLAELIENHVGNKVQVFAYPFGFYQHLSEQILKDMGYRVTLSTKVGVSEIAQGDPESLFAMKRINGGPEVPSDVLVSRLQGK